MAVLGLNEYTKTKKTQQQPQQAKQNWLQKTIKFLELASQRPLGKYTPTNLLVNKYLPQLKMNEAQNQAANISVNPKTYNYMPRGAASSVMNFGQKLGKPSETIGDIILSKIAPGFAEKAKTGREAQRQKVNKALSLPKGVTPEEQIGYGAGKFIGEQLPYIGMGAAGEAVGGAVKGVEAVSKLGKVGSVISKIPAASAFVGTGQILHEPEQGSRAKQALQDLAMFGVFETGSALWKAKYSNVAKVAEDLKTGKKVPLEKVETAVKTDKPMLDNITAKVKPTVEPTIQPTIQKGNIPTPQPIEVQPNAVQKVIQFAQELKPSVEKQKQLYKQERGIRFGKAGETLNKEPGVEGFLKAKGQLKGELPKQPLPKTSVTFTEQDADELVNKIVQHPNLTTGESISAGDALLNLINPKEGKLPQPKQLQLLEKVFGTDFVDALQSNAWRKSSSVATDTLNISRAIMTSMDMSAPLRQGFGLISRPKEFFGAFAKMFKYWGSEDAMKTLQEDIMKKPTYSMMKDTKLAITSYGEKFLGNREENFMSNFAEKIPIVGKLVKASERAYVGFLNKLRSDTFDNIAQKFIKEGSTIENNPKRFQDLANWINVATGRGKLGALEGIAPQLNSLIFSPRFVSSRLNMLNPRFYGTMDPAVRKEAVKGLLTVIGTGMSLLGIAKMGGAKVEMSPISTDFAKIKVGNVTVDPWAGLQPYVRLVAQVASGKEKFAKTGVVRKLDKKSFPFTTRKDKGIDFALSKLAPIPSTAVTLAEGQTVAGQPVTGKSLAGDLLVPMYIQDIKDAWKQMGVNSLIFPGIPGFFGMGSYTRQEKKK